VEDIGIQAAQSVLVEPAEAETEPVEALVELVKMAQPTLVAVVAVMVTLLPAPRAVPV
tara:strand:- start:169 stop:342 length:174 start_codon:yes stop_codon:yes gene_type:complete